MRLIKKDLSRKKPQLISSKTIQPDTIQHKGFGKKITFACDVYLLEKIKNSLQSQRLAGNYQHANLSQIIRQALQAYWEGMPLTYQRQSNPKREISLRLTGELIEIYQSLPLSSKTGILERALGSYCQKYLFN